MDLLGGGKKKKETKTRERAGLQVPGQKNTNKADKSQHPGRRVWAHGHPDSEAHLASQFKELEGWLCFLQFLHHYYYTVPCLRRETEEADTGEEMQVCVWCCEGVKLWEAHSRGRGHAVDNITYTRYVNLAKIIETRNHRLVRHSNKVASTQHMSTKPQFNLIWHSSTARPLGMMAIKLVVAFIYAAVAAAAPASASIGQLHYPVLGKDAALRAVAAAAECDAAAPGTSQRCVRKHSTTGRSAATTVRQVVLLVRLPQSHTLGPAAQVAVGVKWETNTSSSEVLCSV